MAIASKGNLGSTASSSSNQSSITHITSTTALSVGDFGVLLVAVDNNQTTDGDEVAITSVTDSAGNTWVKGAAFTNGQGAAQAGATNELWYTNATAALAIGGTITANFSNATSRDAVAVSAWAYTCGVSLAVEGTPGTLANDGSNAGSLNVTTANVECLRIRSVAIEANNRYISTNTSGWTNMNQAATNAGSESDNQSVVGEFIISTATGAASAPTLSTSSRDLASVYVAFKESSSGSFKARQVMVNRAVARSSYW